jgi:integrase
MQSKQAKIVRPTQERAILGYLVTTRYPARDRVLFLLSMKAGLRAKEMVSLTWAMVTDAAGQVAEVLHVPNRASKGKTGGRTIPLHPDLQAALGALQTVRGDMAPPRAADPVLGAGWGTVTGDCAPVVPSALYVAEDGRVFVALGPPHFHDACGAQSLAGRGQSPGRAGARRPYQRGHDATLHRGRYRGQAQARRAPVSRGCIARRVETHTRPLPHAPRLALGARVGSQAARSSLGKGCCMPASVRQARA